ncbi:class F sortase [Haloglycomyces albus]|uniref:class F sortase n=1 Tax=Haloglycomyces albus TaxID=526067 RepID=UPI00046CF0D7|nr:class F sortase [Haloglycomyces albus]
MSVKHVGVGSRVNTRAAAFVVAVSLCVAGVLLVVRSIEMPAWESGLDRPVDKEMTPQELERHLSGGDDFALPPSTATSLSIDAIGVEAKVDSVGMNGDGDIGAPPMFRSDRTAWFEDSPYPGAEGISVIVGHVDSGRRGPAVFYDLGLVDPGETVEINRKDQTTLVFTVTKVANYPKRAFPYEEIFTPTRRAELRLITCGGPFDRDDGNYTENTVVYGLLTDVKL